MSTAQKYNEFGVLIAPYNDADMFKEARQARFKEYCGLRALPFLSVDQSARLTLLRVLRTRDNLHAFRNRK